VGAVFRKHPTQEQPVPKAQVSTAHPAQGFDPRHFGARCLVWCRADAGVDRNGSTVSGWRDMSGRGRDFSQATASEQPTFASRGLGGRPELTFDGSDDHLDGASFFGMVSAADDWMVVVVVRDWTWGDNVQLYYARGVLGTASGGVTRSNVGVTSEAGAGLGFGCWNAVDGHVQAYGDDSHAQGTSAVMVGVCSGGSLTMRVNGGAGSTVSGTTGLHSSATTLQLGQGNNNVNPWDGAVSEVLIFDGVLRQSELGSLEDYLSHRYSIRMSH